MVPIIIFANATSWFHTANTNKYKLEPDKNLIRLSHHMEVR